MLADRHVIPDRVTPVAYVTFATPHLGSRQHRHLLGTWAPSWASASLFGTTGRQLMLDDDDAGPPLLVRLARPPFITGLALFQKRVAYGNVHGDGIVHYATSTVRRFNPFDGAAPAAPWVVVEDKHDNGDRRPRNAHVNEMVGNLERLDWQRLAVRPGRSLFAHVDIVVVLEAFSAPYGRPIVDDVAERVIGALHDQLLLHPAPSSSLLVRMVDDVLFGSDDADRPAR
ncbi:hypothetical protein PBRA_008265 [Plasmodiophora brassicae]|uniref:DUF676 domain-containing protein n=1 Tax=Plasmodiophora brassicae TaxID=37360 RepID=A0A0G4IZZ5_PLABS|nr:hypothetical protein PBRA_008265 [Plasmodiophora brassicae]